VKLPGYQELSKEQDGVYGLPLEGNFLVTGPPGTGKTVMALYRSALLRRQQRPAHLLTYSRLLSRYVRSATDSLQIDETAVATMHSWLARFWLKNYHKRVPSLAPYRHDWQTIFASMKRLPPKEAPDLLIDEGQDLPKEFYIMARLVSEHLTVFADENQRMTDTNSTLADIRAHAGIDDDGVRTLTRNYRNTREIAAFSARFYTGLPSGIPDLPERTGEPPRLESYPSLAAEVDAIVRYTATNDDLEVGVLLPSKKLVKSFYNRLKGKVAVPIRYYLSGENASIAFDDPGVTILTYQSAKGLEFDTVFLAALNQVTLSPDLPETRMQYYVLTSRARDRLFLSYHDEGDTSIVRMLRENLET